MLQVVGKELIGFVGHLIHVRLLSLQQPVIDFIIIIFIRIFLYVSCDLILHILAESLHFCDFFCFTVELLSEGQFSRGVPFDHLKHVEEHI